MTETEVDWGADSDDSGPEFTGNSMPRGTSRTSTGTGGARQTRGRRVSDKRLAALVDKLSTEMFTAGTMIGLGVPVTGYYICQESNNFCNAVVQLAAHNTQWVAALENIAMVGPGMQVGRTVLGIGAALAADRYYRSGGASGLDPDKRSAIFLGVAQAYYQVHPPSGVYNATGNPDNGYRPPPYGNFSPVS
jgi:hypothetical protein